MKNFGIKMPTKARFRQCPVCHQPKQAREFRVSNRNPKRELICWQCRKNNSEIKSFWGGKFKKFRPQPIDETLQIEISKRLKAHFQKRQKEVKKMSVNEQTANYLKFPDRIAAIVGKTYAVMGDDFKLSDDEALARIRDKLDELDSTLIERNKKKRLSR